MRIGDWVSSIPLHPQLAGLFVHGEGRRTWTSMADEARPLFVAADYLKNPRQIIVVASTYERCLKWQAKLALSGVPEQMMKLLPDGTSALFEDAAPEHIALSDRIGAIEALVHPEPSIILATPGAVLERTLPREVLEEMFIHLKVGDTYEPRDIAKRLKRLGYEVAEPVRIPGQYSVRGGILDIFATGRDTPVRIEFFGDEIESIRTFDLKHPAVDRAVASHQSHSE